MKITTERLKEIIKEELEATQDNEGIEEIEVVDEQIENVLDPQNWEIVFQALQKVFLEIGLPASGIGLILDKLRKKLKLGGGEPPDENL